MLQISAILKGSNLTETTSNTTIKGTTWSSSASVSIFMEEDIFIP